MIHLEEELIQRLLHGELEPASERLARQHLAGCDECLALLEEARADEHRLFGLLRELDHPLPDPDPRVMLAGGHPRSPWGRWAAGFLLVAAAGAAYAAPGSPLPAALGRLVGRSDPVPAPSGPPTSPGGPTTAGAGVAVSPGEGLTIRFVLERDSAVLTVSLFDGEEVMVRTVEGAAGFDADTGFLTIRSAGPVRFEVLIPRQAPSIEIQSGDTPVFAKRASGVVTGIEPDASGVYTVPLYPRVR